MAVAVATVHCAHAAGTDWKTQITNAEYGHGLTMSPEEHYWYAHTSTLRGTRHCIALHVPKQALNQAYTTETHRSIPDNIRGH